MRLRLTRLAQDDIAAILRKTQKLFGDAPALAYATVIDRGVAMIADEPLRASSLARNDIARGVRSFHLELAACRRNGASHILYYRPITTRSEEEIIVVLRVLHEVMEPKRRLIAALRTQDETDRR